MFLVVHSRTRQQLAAKKTLHSWAMRSESEASQTNNKDDMSLVSLYEDVVWADYKPTTHQKWCLLLAVLAAASAGHDITCPIRRRVIYCDVSVHDRYLKDWKHEVEQMLCYNSNSSFKWTHVYKVSLFKNKGEILRPVAYFFNIIDKQMYTVLFSYHHILVPY